MTASETRVSVLPVYVTLMIVAAISLRAYRSRNFVVGSVYVVVLGMMLYGQMYVVPQFLRNVQHHSAWGTGKLQTLNAAAFAIGLVLGALLLLMRRLGFHVALSVGAAVFAAGMVCWTIRLTPTISDQAMFLPLTLIGFGAGWQIGPISTLINSKTPDTLMGEGMELYLCQRQLGGRWGTAILAILLDRQRSFWSGRLGEHLNEYNLAADEALRQGAAALCTLGLPPSHADAGAIGLLHGRLVVQSVVNAFADTFAYQAALGVFALVLLMFLARARPLEGAVQWAVVMVR